jgi:hypothetical protein
LLLASGGGQMGEIIAHYLDQEPVSASVRLLRAAAAVPSPQESGTAWTDRVHQRGQVLCISAAQTDLTQTRAYAYPRQAAIKTISQVLSQS